ncbi:hypothetical protein C8R44DRAFT_886367 [Mycena epipterygia]|nr:hypothetical protein C8R44DRAFT_886367 [Mycena epipterygia]
MPMQEHHSRYSARARCLPPNPRIYCVPMRFIVILPRPPFQFVSIRAAAAYNPPTHNGILLVLSILPLIYTPARARRPSPPFFLFLPSCYPAETSAHPSHRYISFSAHYWPPAPVPAVAYACFERAALRVPQIGPGSGL